jgi:TetR/AcrR family transcriptional regulator
MARVAGHPPTRDRERSRQRILDAAEERFAADGFDRVTMAEVGAAAGLSRGAPGYLFGSKLGLYEAVLARLFDAREAVLREPWSALAQAPDAEVPARLHAAVRAYLAFLHSRPSFIAITEREALAGAPHLGRAPGRSTSIEDALRALAERRPFRINSALMVVLSVGMFPLVHRDTVLAPRGIDPSDAEVLERHIVLVTDLTLAVIEGRAGI